MKIRIVQEEIQDNLTKPVVADFTGEPTEEGIVSPEVTNDELYDDSISAEDLEEVIVESLLMINTLKEEQRMQPFLESLDDEEFEFFNILEEAYTKEILIEEILTESRRSRALKRDAKELEKNATKSTKREIKEIRKRQRSGKMSSEEAANAEKKIIDTRDSRYKNADKDKKKSEQLRSQD
jgi:hypothetical protein